MRKAIVALVFASLSIGMRGQEIDAVSTIGSILPRNDSPVSHNPRDLPILVKVNLVLVPVTVTDGDGRAVTGLDRDEFQIFEDGQRQTIHHVSYEDAPISVGIIFDTSKSMATKLSYAREAVRAFMDAANVDDEFFMITFADRPTVVSEFTTSPDSILSQATFSVAKGTTALLDSIYLGLARLRQAHFERKALFIISDGGDNHSRYTERELRRALRESGTLVYAVGIYDHSFATAEEEAGPALLATFAHDTGGRAFSIDDPRLLPLVAGQVGRDLRTQCVLSYRPAIPKIDGKWHTIKVKLSLPKSTRILSVNARRGYYAPAE